MTKVFLPRTKPPDPNQRRLLVLDGHHSHVTIDFMWLCFQNNVQLLYLPAHCSHVLQPLDLGVFSSLKNAYRRLLYSRMVEGLDESSVTGKRLFLECYRLAREEGMSIRNIRSGWKATGLWPVNMSKPLLSPFLMANSNARDAVSTPNAPYTPSEPMISRGATLEDYGHT